MSVTSLPDSRAALPLVAPHYEPSRFVECTAQAAIGLPDEGC